MTQIRAASNRVVTRYGNEGTDMTSRASISSLTRMAPSWAVKRQPIWAASPNAVSKRRQLSRVAKGGEQPRERCQADDVEPLEAGDSELDADHGRQEGRDHDGAGRDGEDPAAEGDLGEQAPDLSAVVAQHQWDRHDHVDHEEQQLAQPDLLTSYAPSRDCRRATPPAGPPAWA
jgi:hypothetical protein